MRTQSAIPSIDTKYDPQRVNAARQRNSALGEGRDTTEGMREGGIGEEVALQRRLLLARVARSQGRDDARNLLD